MANNQRNTQDQNPLNQFNTTDPMNPFSLQSQWSGLLPYVPQFNQTQPPQMSQQFSQQPPSMPQQFSQPPPPEQWAAFLKWQQQMGQPPLPSDEAAPSFVGDTGTPTSAKTKKKGKGLTATSPEKPQKKTYPPGTVHNWLPADELRLAESWITISEDSNRGNAQTGMTFWYLIQKDYNERNPPVQRTKDALSSKWTKLSAECNKYNGIFARLSRERRSGESDIDLRNRCDMQFRAENAKNFSSHLAWDFLKDKPKWLVPDPVVVGRRNRRPPTVNVDDEEPDAFDMAGFQDNTAMFSPHPIPRPAGKQRKARKTTSSSTASGSSSFEECIPKLNEKRDAYYSKKIYREQLQIVAMKTEGLDDKYKRFLEAEKERVIDEITAMRRAAAHGTGSSMGAGGSGTAAGGSGAEIEDVGSSTEEDEDRL